MEDLVRIILGVIIGVLIFALIAYIFYVICLWFILKKGNQPGWAAIIPIYNQICLYRLVGITPYWLLVMFALGFLGNIDGDNIKLVIGAITAVVSIYLNVVVSVSLSRSFGKGEGFAICTFLFPYVCYPILAFGGSTYLGPKPMNDFFTNLVNGKHDNNSSVQPAYSNPNTTSNEQVKFCANCGAKMGISENFCPQCGSKQ